MKLYLVLRKLDADRDYFHISENGFEGQYFTNIEDAKKLASSDCVIHEIEVQEISWK